VPRESLGEDHDVLVLGIIAKKSVWKSTRPARHFCVNRLHLNHGRDCHELKHGDSIKLAWLGSFFLHWLNL
jgi:hypothetical protein